MSSCDRRDNVRDPDIARAHPGYIIRATMAPTDRARRQTHGARCALKPDLLKQFNLICRSSPGEKNISFLSLPNHSLIPFYPVPRKGALAIVTDVGMGCGGRGSVVARGNRRAGLSVFVSDRPARGRTAQFADGKDVWFWHPLLVSSRRRRCRSRPGFEASP